MATFLSTGPWSLAQYNCCTVRIEREKKIHSYIGTATETGEGYFIGELVNFRYNCMAHVSNGSPGVHFKRENFSLLLLLFLSFTPWRNTIEC